MKRIYIYSFRPTVNNGTSIVCKLRYFTFGLNIKKSPHGFLPGIRYEDGLNNQYYSIIDPCNLWNKTWKKQNLYFGNWRVYNASFRGEQNHIIRHNAPVRMNMNHRLFFTPAIVQQELRGKKSDFKKLSFWHKVWLCNPYIQCRRP